MASQVLYQLTSEFILIIIMQLDSITIKSRGLLTSSTVCSLINEGSFC
jgi:hypothetical protein